MENKGKIIGVGIVIVVIIWCLLIPKVNDITKLELLIATQDVLKWDLNELTNYDVSDEQRQKKIEDFNTAQKNVEDLKRTTSGRGNKAAINYTQNMLELQKDVIGDYEIYTKVKNSKVHPLIITYFLKTQVEMADKTVPALEFDSLLLWVYNEVIL